MSLYLEKKFTLFLSTKIPKFKQKDDYLWNFRCMFCGDSKKNKFKARGYIYRKKSNLFFICHNCQKSLKFSTFLKHVDASLYNQFQLESMSEKASNTNTTVVDSSLFVSKPFPLQQTKNKIDLPTLNSLDDDNEGKIYAKNRKIPRDYMTKLYYANDFKKFVEMLHPSYDKLASLKQNESRIIIPFYDQNNMLLGFQGRAINPSKIKYITIKLHESNKKIFGLNNVNFKQRIYVLEGPIDSMFLPNSIATMDASLDRVIDDLGCHDFVFIFDNEPRNKEIISHMKKIINLNKNICIWPNNIEEKDINDMILSGKSKSQILGIIDTHTFSNLRANLEFERWKKL